MLADFEDSGSQNSHSFSGKGDPTCSNLVPVIKTACEI